MIQTPSAAMYTDPEQVAKAVLFPGDPLRAKSLAEQYLSNVICFNTVRGMLGYTGNYQGRRISVMGSGMGIPSATIYAHDLFHFFHVDAIIRIGTAGAFADQVKLGDLVIAMAASTNSAFSRQYDFPGLLSPCADYDLLSQAVQSAADRQLPYHVGAVFTSDSFYNESPGVNEKCRALGLLAVDMETAGIYWEAMAAQKRALSILTASNHIFSGEEMSVEERQNSLTAMMETALDTVWQFA